MNKKITFYDVKLHHLAPGDTKVRFDFLVGFENLAPHDLNLRGYKSVLGLESFRSFCTKFNSDDLVNVNITIEVVDEQK